MRILQINSSDIGGGAEKMAWGLFSAYRSRGLPSWLAVGRKYSADPDVFPIAHADAARGWGRPLWGLYERWHMEPRRGPKWLAAQAAMLAAEPLTLLDRYRGRELFRFPGAWGLLRLTPQRPDILHGHNLHGNYFDLRALPWLSRQVPTVLTMHDAWLLSGHCAHGLDCERWATGCGQCPYLELYPALRADDTAANWRRKATIYAGSQLYVATPSQWLMDRVQRSMLMAGVREARVIPNGIDTGIFRPGDRARARRALDIAPETPVILLVANGLRQNMWKDYQLLRGAIERIAAATAGRPVAFLALGEEGPPEQIGQATVRFIGFKSDPTAVATYYQAADLYLHAARADTFPSTVIEALACGTPCVATAVGGIPEQVRGLALAHSALNRHSAAEATGVLTPPGDSEAMATAVLALLGDEGLRRQLDANAARDAAERFTESRQNGAYLRWYEEILTNRDNRSPGEA